MLSPAKLRNACPYENCSSAFDRPHKLTLHLLTHANVKPFDCPEENCSKSYTSRSHLDRHINTAHRNVGDNMIYSCPTCQKTFSNRQNLKKHIKVIHDPDRSTFSCAHCNEKFNKKHQLNSHMFKHTGVKSFSCDLCEKCFITPLEKRKHMRCHKTYSCQDCFLVFDHWSTYQKHKKSEHAAKEYICDICNRKFKKRGHILHHMKVHYRTPTILTVFTCPIEGCSREYTRKSNMTQHIKIFHDKIKHDCHICGAQLSTKSKLNSHIKLHEGSKCSLPPKRKTKATGRKERKDKGTLKKIVTALRVAGMTQEHFEDSGILETSLVEGSSLETALQSQTSTSNIEVQAT